MADTRRLDAYRFHERDWESYEQLRGAFEHEIPEEFNIAAYICDRHAERDKGAVALFADGVDRDRGVWTFWRLRNEANRLSNYLASRGVGRGDRVGLTGTQKPETLISYLAVWKLGATAVPVSGLSGPEGLVYRLGDAGAEAFVADGQVVDALDAARDDLDLHTVLTVDDESDTGGDFWDAIEGESREFETVATDPEEVAVILYTSGTTGAPKGVILPHRTFLGHLPSMAAGQWNMAIESDDVFWQPGEWSWVVIFMLLPSLFYGKPVVGYHRGSFDPVETFGLIERFGITEFFTTPALAHMMMEADPGPFDLRTVRVITIGGQDIDTKSVEWLEDTFGNAVVNRSYGQTEANLPLIEIEAFDKRREGSIGVPQPGYEVAIVDPETAEPLPADEVGEIAMRYDHPVCFEGYLGRPEATAEKVRNGWVLTEDLGWRDEDGYYYFLSRADDVIISSGYRIGPEEIETTLAEHGAVSAAGVIGVPDDTRGEVPKAFVTLNEGSEPSADLREELQAFVKERLAKYEYPRELEFVDEMPLTSTEKVDRNALREREGVQSSG